MDTVNVVLPIMRRKQILLKDAIASWTDSMEHTSLFNKLQGVTIGGENMYDHIVKNYVYSSYSLAVKNNFRAKILRIYNLIHQGHDYCDCHSCWTGWRSRRDTREMFLNRGYSWDTDGYRDFVVALRLYVENTTELRTCYNLISEGNKYKNYLYKYKLDNFLSIERDSSFCNGEIKKSRCWTCDKTGKEIKIKCCCNSNTAGNGYCKAHSK